MAAPSFLRSLRHAWHGVRLCFRTERNFRIQVAVALLVLAASCALPLARLERLILLFVVMTVLVLELLNSSIERVVDLVKPRLHEYVGDIKDLMAGAVLVASLFSLVIGAVIFWPYLSFLFGSL